MTDATGLSVETYELTSADYTNYADKKENQRNGRQEQERKRCDTHPWVLTRPAVSCSCLLTLLPDFPFV